jgi:hypothetical protein
MPNLALIEMKRITVWRGLRILCSESSGGPYKLGKVNNLQFFKNVYNKIAARLFPDFKAFTGCMHLMM